MRVDAWDGAYLDSLGWVYYQLGLYGDARGPLERAAREYPKDPVILDHLGDLYARVGEWELAVAAWSRALDTEPETADTLRSKIAISQERLSPSETSTAVDSRLESSAPLRP